jgi:hypothetical protein
LAPNIDASRDAGVEARVEVRALLSRITDARPSCQEDRGGQNLPAKRLVAARAVINPAPLESMLYGIVSWHLSFPNMGW